MTYLDSSLDDLVRQRKQQAPPPPAPSPSDDQAKQAGFSPSQIASMTHQPEQPNQAAPWLRRVQQFAGGGLSEVLGWHPGMTKRIAGGLAEAASYATPLGMPLGIMAGERGYREFMSRAIGAPKSPGRYALGDLETAKQMEQMGFDRSQIRAATQWYKEHPSMGWNKEIPDVNSRLNLKRIPGGNYTVEDSKVGFVLNHSDLYSVYPHLRNLPLSFVNDPRNRAYASFVHPNPADPAGRILIFNPHLRDAETIHSSIMHELTHAVDHYEGRPSMTRTGLSYQNYLKLIHEVRARNTEYRMTFSPEELAKESMDPWKTQEIMPRGVAEKDVTLTPPPIPIATPYQWRP